MCKWKSQAATTRHEPLLSKSTIVYRDHVVPSPLLSATPRRLHVNHTTSLFLVKDRMHAFFALLRVERIVLSVPSFQVVFGLRSTRWTPRFLFLLPPWENFPSIVWIITFSKVRYISHPQFLAKYLINLTIGKDELSRRLLGFLIPWTHNTFFIYASHSFLLLLFLFVSYFRE